MKYFFIILFLFSISRSSSQESSSLYRLKTVTVTDNIQLDSVSINPSSFFITNLKNERIPAALYSVDFQKATLSFTQNTTQDSIRVHYLRYPKFITKTYQEIEESVIVNRTGNLQKLYRLSEPSEAPAISPFHGLMSSGSISRGVTI